MTKKEFIKAVAVTAEMTDTNAGIATEAVLKAITDTLSKKDTIIFPGFGSFKTTDKEERMGRNPRTGEQVKISARTVPSFSAGKSLKEAVNK